MLYAVEFYVFQMNLIIISSKTNVCVIETPEYVHMQFCIP